MTPLHQPISSSTTPAVRVEVRGVSRTFPGGVRAVDDVSLSIPAGQFIALLGPSGCGKSTLLRMIAGLDRPDTGTIAPTAGTEAGFVFQDAHLLPWRSVLANVALPLEVAGVAKPARLAAARAVLDEVGLSDAVARYPAELSGGMRMRASLARALVARPGLLLLDEPFAALDEITRQRLDDQLRALWLQRGMTVIFVTHSTQEAAFLVDRAIVFSSRPARVVLDHAFDLPVERTADLRTTQQFAVESRKLFDALSLGEAGR